jgi:hypothetical protein
MDPEQKPTIQYAGRMAQLPPYLFGMINQMKMEKRWKGDDVIDLGMGNPVDPAPGLVIEKLVEVANDPKTHRYPVAYGMRNLRIEIAKSYEKDYGVALDADAEVICTIGSKEGISHLCLALIGPGDTVLVPAPAFPVHIYAAIIAGGSVLRIPLEEEGAFLAHLETMCANVYPAAQGADSQLSPQPHRRAGQQVAVRAGGLPGQKIWFHGDPRFCLQQDHLRRLRGAELFGGARRPGRGGGVRLLFQVLQHGRLAPGLLRGQQGDGHRPAPDQRATTITASFPPSRSPVSWPCATATRM